MKDTLWVTKDGRQIWVRQMARSHILNSIAKIQRTPGWRDQYLLRLQLELRIRDILGEQH